MNPSRMAVSVLAVTLVWSLGAPAAVRAQETTPSVRLVPARAEGTIARGQTIGPFTISNATDQAYRVRVFPVLLGQDRTGGLHVREDAAALRDARRRLGVQVNAFPFAPGAARSVFGVTRRAPRGAGFYGGILFRATPTGRIRQQIRNILQINARVMLDPPAEQRRIAWETGAVRAQQDGTRRLRLLVPVTNRGNTFARVEGVVRVRDAGGRVVTARRLPGLRVLPGATVDLPTRMSRPQLAPGAYALEASLRGAGKRVRAAGAMRLFAVNEVRTQLARLVDFPSPRAYIGEETDVKATFRNTGNVKWAPAAQLEVRALRGDGASAVLQRVDLDAEEVAPGARGEVSGKVRLPEGIRSFDLRVRLLASGRELDARANSVTPVKRPPLTTRIGDFVTENALVIVLLLLGAIALGSLAAVRYIRRVSSGADGPGGAGAKPAPVRVSGGGGNGGGWAVVQVAGEVRSPGVYRLRAGERVDDAVRMAGGATARAELSGVNLAAKVEDGRQVIVPARAAAAGGSVPSANGSASPAAGSAPPGAPLNLNTATPEQLGALDGIGPATAQKIVAYRQAHGGFRSVAELDRVPGIGPKRLAALKPRLTV